MYYTRRRYDAAFLALIVFTGLLGGLIWTGAWDTSENVQKTTIMVCSDPIMTGGEVALDTSDGENYVLPIAMQNGYRAEVAPELDVRKGVYQLSYVSSKGGKVNRVTGAEEQTASTSYEGSCPIYNY